MPMYDLHTHTFLSDGELGPEELLRRAETRGVRGLAITDHVDTITLSRTLRTYTRQWDHLLEGSPIPVVLGCELTHVTPDSIPALARQAREEGAQLVVVHGESPVEPVREGTNRAAAGCEFVDILAHPGTIDPEVAERAVDNDVVLELSGRDGHSFTNGHVAQVAREVGAELVFSTDAHAPGDLMDESTAHRTIAGTGIDRPGTVLDRTEELFDEAFARDVL